MLCILLLLSQFQEWAMQPAALAPDRFMLSDKYRSPISSIFFFFLIKLDYASQGLSGGSRGKSGDLHCG
jgi:hypothetical protein